MTTTDLDFTIGDILESVSPHSLAHRIRVKSITPAFLMAEVLEGPNQREPVKVFRAGWTLYRRVDQ